MSVLTELLNALQDDICGAVLKAAAKQLGDAAVSLDSARKRLTDGQEVLANAADRLRFSQRVWSIFCGSAAGATSTAASTRQGEAPRRLLDCLASLQEAACTSAGSSSAKVTSATLQLLRVALTPGLRVGASVTQLVRLRQQVWALLTTLDVVNKLKDAQVECFLLVADLMPRVEGSETTTADERSTSVGVALSAVQFGVREVLHKCGDLARKSAVGGQRLRAVALHLMGAAAAAYPNDVRAEQAFVLTAFEQAARRLAEQQEVEQSVGEGLLDGLSAFLSVFPLHFDVASERSFLIFIHQLVKNALLLAENSTNYRFCDAALRFLTARAVDTLAACIHDDATSYVSLLHKLWCHKNRNVHRAAYAATPRCLQALSQQLLDAASPSTSRHQPRRCPEEVIEEVLVTVKVILNAGTVADDNLAGSGGTNPSELSFIFVVCGYMARPVRVCISAEALDALFGQITNKIDWLLASFVRVNDVVSLHVSADAATISDRALGDAEGGLHAVQRDHNDGIGHEDVARLIPHLLVAFSCLLAEVPRMTSKAQRALASLVGVVLQTLPSDLYFERLRAATVPSLVKLLLVAERNASTGLDVCAYLCEQIVWFACVVPEVRHRVDTEEAEETFAGRGTEEEDWWTSTSRATTTTTTVPLAEASMPVWWRRVPLVQRQALYAQFLRSLLMECDKCCSTQWGAPWSTLSTADVARHLREELARTILDSVAVLNVTVLFKGRPASTNVVLAHTAVGGTDDLADGLRPQSPRDYAFLLHLIRFHSDLASCLWRPGAAVVGVSDGHAQLSRWVLELAVASNASPHVSGYYTLLYTALRSAAVTLRTRQQSSICDCSASSGTGRCRCASGLTEEAERALVRWQRQCARRLSMYTQDLLYQCAVAYITITAVRAVPKVRRVCGKNAARDQLDLGPLQKAFTVVLASAPTVTDGGESVIRGATDEALSARATEATVRFVLDVLTDLVATQPSVATHLLPALLVAPELGERKDVRAVLSELTARYGDRIAAAAERESLHAPHGSDAAESGLTMPTRGTTPLPPHWRTKKALLALPFPSDGLVEFPITVVLARVAYLSCHAGPQCVRSPAAELLHFAVVWLLGASKKEAERGGDGDGDAGPTSWLPTVLPAMLHLASGQTQDGIAQELFRDLLLQTSRWTSLLSLRWPKSSAVVRAQRALEKALCDHLSSQHAPLRRIAAEALDAYLNWFARQAVEHGHSAAALSSVMARCAGVLSRIRLDLRAAHRQARLGAVTLFHLLLVHMRQDDGVGSVRSSSMSLQASPHELPALCALVLNDWFLWLSALVACLRRTLYRSGRSGSVGDMTSVEGDDEDDACGLVAETIAAFDALHGLLVDAGPAGNAARRAVVQRYGVAVPMSSETAAAAPDALPELLKDVLELCWLLCARAHLDAVKTLWRVFTALCSCVHGGSEEQKGAGRGEQAALATIAKDHVEARAARQWLQECGSTGGEVALCTLLQRGLTGTTGTATESADADRCTALASSLTWCAFLSTLGRGTHAGVKRTRSHDATSRVMGVVTEVVQCAVACFSASTLTRATKTTVHDDVLLTALARLVRASTVQADGANEESETRLHLVDWSAVQAHVLVRPVFERAAYAFFSASGPAGTTHIVAERVMGTLYTAAEASASTLCLSEFAEVVGAALPPAFVAPRDATDIISSLAQPLHARSTLASLVRVAALASLPRPTGRGSVNILSTVLARSPRHQQERLRQSWAGVLQRVVLDEQATALPRPERSALLESLFLVCLCLGTDSGTSTPDLPRTLASLLPRLLPDAAHSSPSISRPVMVQPSQACCAALRRLLRADEEVRATNTLTALICVLSEAVSGPLLGADVSDKTDADRRSTREEWQTERELPVLLLFQLLAVSGTNASARSGSVHSVRRLLSPLVPVCRVCDEANGTEAEASNTSGAELAVWHDASRMEVVLRLLCAMHPRRGGTDEDAQVDAVVCALAAAAGCGERWSDGLHRLLASATAVRLLELAVRTLTVWGLTPLSSPLQASSRYLTCARDVLLANLKAELPLDWKDLAPDSVEACAMPRVVHSLVALACAMAAHAADVLTRLLPLLAQTDMPGAEIVAEMVAAAIAQLSPQRRLELCEACVALQHGGGGLPPSMWWSATYRLMLPALMSFAPDARVHFFSTHVMEWVNEAGRAVPPLASPHRQTNALVLLESMYRLTDGTTLRGAINDAFVESRGVGGGACQKTGKELVLALIKLCNTARTATPVSNAADGAAVSVAAASAANEDWIAYRQAALRCLVAVVMATQQQEAVFVKLLLDASNVDGWRKVVDSRACGVMPVESDFLQAPEHVAKSCSDWELRTRPLIARSNVAQRVGSLLEQLRADEAIEAAAAAEEAGVGSDDGEMGLQDSMWFLTTGPSGGRLSTAMTLAMDTQPSTAAMGLADANTDCAMRGPPVAVPLDGVWRSTCLGALFRALDYMIAQFTTAAQAAWAPAWVMELWKLLVSPVQPLEVKLVVVRLILLRPAFFGRYGARFVEPMVDVIAQPALGSQLHYMAREVLCIVLDWIRPPMHDDEDDDAAADEEEEEERGRGGNTAAHARGGRAETATEPVVHLSASTVNKLMRYLFVALLMSSSEDSGEQYVLRNNIDLFKAACTALGPVSLCAAMSDAPVLEMLATATDSASMRGAPVAPATGVSPAHTSTCSARMEVFVQLLGVLVNSGVCLAAVWTNAATRSAASAAQVTTSTAIYHSLVSLISRGAMALAVAAAEVVAVELQTLAERGFAESSLTALEVEVREAVEALWSRAPLTALSVLRVMEAYHQRILTPSLATMVFTGFTIRSEEAQLLILDVLGSAVDTAVAIYNAIIAQFVGVLSSYKISVRTALYGLLHLLVPRLSAPAVCQTVTVFLSDAALAVMHDSSDDARTRFFQVTIAAHSRLIALKESVGGEPAGVAREQEEATRQCEQADARLMSLMTVTGLSDSSATPFIQDLILAHLDEQVYPDSPAARLTVLLENLSPSRSGEMPRDDVGRHTHWLRHMAVLLLSPCRRTRACGDLNYLFDAPLADCRFVPKSFAASATRSTQGRQAAPLFSESLSTLAGQTHAIASRTPVPLTFVGASQRPSPAYQTAIAASRSRSTHTTIGGVSSARSSRVDSRLEAYRGVRRRPLTVFPSSVQPQSLSTALFTTHQSCQARTAAGSREGTSQVSSQLLSQRVTGAHEGPRSARGIGRGVRRELVAHRLHALPLAGREVLFMAAASRERRERQEQQQEQQRQQLRHRVLFRLYRDGDFPDVQVPVAAFLAPLQALCLYDAATAELTAVALLKAILAPVRMPERLQTEARPHSTGSAHVPRPFFARPTSPLPTSADDEGATAVRALHAFLLATTTTALSATTPAPVLHAVQELLLYVTLKQTPPAHRTEPQEDPRETSPLAVVTERLAQLVMARQGGRALSATNEAIGATALLHEYLLVSREQSSVAATRAWTRLAQLLGQLEEPDMLCAALIRAAHATPTDAASDSCLGALQAALHAETSGAYEQAMALFATCTELLPSSVFVRGTSHSPSSAGDTQQVAAVRALLQHRRTQAARAILRWDSVRALCTEEEEAAAEDAACMPGVPSFPASEAAVIALEASRHVSVGHVPALFTRLCQLSGGRARVERDSPFEAVAASLLAGHWAQSEEQAHNAVTHVLKRFRDDGHARLDEEAARACQDAYGLRQAQRVAGVLVQVIENHPGAAHSVQQLAATGFAPLISPTPVMADNALWLLQMTMQALEGPMREQFGAAVWAETEKAFADARFSLCRAAAESLLRAPRTNGAVKALLDVVVAAMGTTPAPLLYATALRANLYRLAHTGPQQTNITTSALIEGLARRVQSQGTTLSPAELRALQVDMDWCAMRLLLHESGGGGGRALTSSSSSLSLTVFMAHASRMHAQLAESVDEHLRLLDVLDRMLGAPENTKDAKEVLTGIDDDEEQAGDARPTAAETPTAELCACWKLYVTVFSWAAETVGTGNVTDPATSVDVAMMVPRTLQFFDFITRHNAHIFSTEEPTGDGSGRDEIAALTDRLVALPLSIWQPWPSQLVSTALRTRQLAPVQILLRLAEVSPQAMYFPCHCAAEELCAMGASHTTPAPVKSALQQLRYVLEDAPRLRRARLLAQSLIALHEPDLRLGTALRQINRLYRTFVNTSTGTTDEQRERAYCDANRILQQSWNLFADGRGMSARETVRQAFREVATRVLRAFAKPTNSADHDVHNAPTLCRDRDQFRQASQSAEKELRAASENRKPTARIEEYSAVLDALLCHATDRVRSGNQNQIVYGNARPSVQPGIGDRGEDQEDQEEPLVVPVQPVLALTASIGGSADAAGLQTEYVVGANPIVRVQHSLQRPKRLELYSSSMSSHVYLAKGGDDLRLDQRVEELFSVLNQHLQRRTGLASLSVHTYSVIPLSAHVGLVQWVPQTETLYSVMDRESGHRLKEDPAYTEYRARYQSIPQCAAYLESFRRDSPAEAATWYETLVNKTTPELLARGLQQVSPSLCRWYEVRDGFVKSNSALSISAHVFGIGDRHLENFLISTRSGRVIGIDYGHAFGSATEGLPLPELVPFRLTPQIRAACGVLGDAALASAMVNVLHTLRQHRSVMESLAQAFVHEPLTQWKQLKPEQRELFARRKLRSVTHKLDLEAPWNSLLACLGNNQGVMQYERQHGGGSGRSSHWLLARIRDAVMYVPSRGQDEESGERGYHEARPVVVSSEERHAESAYVRQLLDLSQNSAVLSRAYAGWNPLF